MNTERLSFVSFKPENSGYTGHVPIEELWSSNRDYETVLQEASNLYEGSIVRMQRMIDEINSYRNQRRLLPARKIWKLGIMIFTLIEDLKGLSLQIDGLYDHLCRDLNVKRKWLEKVIIFRRYIPNVSLIPDSLNWGRCEKGTRKIAERIAQGNT